jgi:radical SAM protein with 4Fe4S-binding SPASM domain
LSFFAWTYYNKKLKRFGYNYTMGFYLTRQTALKLLEVPSAYHIARDELYELDQDSFRFLASCASDDGCNARDSAFIDYCLDEGLLTREIVSVRRPSLLPSPCPSLRYLELQITNRCNLRCRHCYIVNGADRELSVVEVRSILKELEEMQGLRVLITGGEPLLHSRFDEINESLQDLYLHKVLFTNGMLLRKDVLMKLKVHEIQVSIDGMQDAHDSVRGAGTWSISIDAVRSALDAGFDVSVSTMVHRGNLTDFDAMEDHFRSLGVKEWTVDIPCATGRMHQNQDLLVSPEVGGKYLGYGFGGGMHATGPGYACGLHLMAVLPDGKAAKCTFYGNRPVGTIDEGLRACWERVRPIRLDSLDCSCEFREACRGGCRYRAELLGHPLGRDFYRCSLYGIIDKPE